MGLKTEAKHAYNGINPGQNTNIRGEGRVPVPTALVLLTPPSLGAGEALLTQCGQIRGWTGLWGRIGGWAGLTWRWAEKYEVK